MSPRRCARLVLGGWLTCGLASLAALAACSGLKAAEPADGGSGGEEDGSPPGVDGAPGDAATGDSSKRRVVQVLASGFTNPHEITLDQDTVYFTQEFDQVSTVRKVKKDGTGSEIVAPYDAASGLNPYAADIVVAGDDVAWVNTTASAGGVYARRRDGAGPVRRLKGPLDTPYRLAFADGELFYVDRSFNPRTYALYRFPSDGGPSIPIADYQVRVEGLAVDSTSIYWTHSGPLGPGAKNGVRKSSRTLADSSLDLHVGNDNGELGGIALGAAEVFWADREGGRVVRIGKTGGVKTELASGLAAPVRVAFDGTHVYFTQHGATTAKDGRISRVPAGGGAVEDLATGVDHPWGIAVDATHVYWTAYGGGEVARVEK